MKLSQFNIIFDNAGKSYITNTFSKGIIELDEHHRNIISDKRLDLLTENEIALLLEKGFAVEDDIDEIGLLRYRSYKQRNSKEEMEFVIAPTLDCNFTCKYCFEKKRSGKMSKETQKKVLDYIFRITDTEDNKRIHIIWFGGEPLLYPDIVLNMNMAIFKYCQAKGKTLKSDVITNGFLLSEKLIGELIKCHIEHLQITIDGNRELHNQRRVLSNGLPTYDTIYNNLKLFRGTTLTVTLRINIDKSNVNSISELERDIQKLKNENIACSPALVEVSNHHFEDIKSTCISEDDELYDYYNNSYLKKYFSSQSSLDYGLRLFFCEAEHYYSFAIDEIGNVYKCWNSLGVEKDIYCTVEDETPNPAILSTYFSRDPFTESKCISCAYIPICAGGCLMQRKLRNNDNYCSDCKYTFINAAIKEIENSH